MSLIHRYSVSFALEVFTARHCVNMPSLTDLPLEIRQKIYALLLTSPEELTIRPVNEFSRTIHSHTVLSGHKLPSVIDLPLTRVSKQIRADALPLLYGGHRFNFLSSKTLKLFLEQIGFARKHLRHISIYGGGYEHGSSKFRTASRDAFGLLALAGGLQSLTVSHLDFCASSKESRYSKTDLDHFADACVPLLSILNYARKRNGMKGSALDIVKIQLLECVGCSGCRYSGRQVSSRRRVNESGTRNSSQRCSCLCAEADANNEAMIEQFRSRVAEKICFDD